MIPRGRGQFITGTWTRTSGTPRAPRLPRGRLFREHAEAERERHLPRHTSPRPRRTPGPPGWLRKAAANTAIFDNTERVDVGTYGSDAAFKWRGFSAQGEYFGKAEGQNLGRTVHSRGFYGQAGYFLLPKKLEVAARYSSVDPNRDKSEDLQIEVTGAVSCYSQGHNDTEYARRYVC